MKFKFAFEKLLQHRRREEELAMRDFLLAREKYDQAQAQLDQFYQQIVDCRNLSTSLHQAGGNQAESLKQNDEFIAGQQVRIGRHRVWMRTLAQEMEEKHEVAVQKAQDTKVLDKLKEKWAAKHKDALKKHEQKELDEIVTMRFRLGSEEL